MAALNSNLLLLTSVAVLALTNQVSSQLWDQWWNYESGLSGPSSWSINPTWRFCSLGKLQSPIDIRPADLLYDSNLKHLSVSKPTMTVTLMNTGHDLTVKLDGSRHEVKITEGPLSYEHIADKIIIHFGGRDEQGSEHMIDGRAFPAEVQIYGYNSALYTNMSQAESSHVGVVGLALLVSINETMQSTGLSQIVSALSDVQYKDTKTEIPEFSVHNLLPSTKNYITYEGSLTSPGCFETVTWIVMNKPIYISMSQLELLRQTLRSTQSSGMKLKMENNYRPVQSSSRRAIRTNINFKSDKASTCDIQREKTYAVNQAVVVNSRL